MNLKPVQLRLETEEIRRILQRDLPLRDNTQSGDVLFFGNPGFKVDM
jgi:hypothetical protein